MRWDARIRRQCSCEYCRPEAAEPAGEARPSARSGALSAAWPSRSWTSVQKSPSRAPSSNGELPVLVLQIVGVPIVTVLTRLAGRQSEECSVSKRGDHPTRGEQGVAAELWCAPTSSLREREVDWGVLRSGRGRYCVHTGGDMRMVCSQAPCQPSSVQER